MKEERNVSVGLEPLSSRDMRDAPERHHSLLGCHISDKNFIFGGFNGKSCGNDMVARRKAPS
jgi:hypothetical protein